MNTPELEAYFETGLDILCRLLEQGGVDDEGDFLLGDDWPETGHPEAPAIILEIEEFLRDAGRPVKARRASDPNLTTYTVQVTEMRAYTVDYLVEATSIEDAVRVAEAGDTVGEDNAVFEGISDRAATSIPTPIIK